MEGYGTYMAQVAESMLLKSPFNETHTINPHYTNLYNQANATANLAGPVADILGMLPAFF